MNGVKKTNYLTIKLTGWCKSHPKQKGKNMILEYTTDGIDFHFVTLFNSKKKINKIFQGSTKKEVKEKVVNWVEKNLPDVPLWKIKLTNYQIR